MYINETNIKVRYVETDQMGIVHHSNYYAYFEVGRTEFISYSGITYSQMEGENVMMPVIESHCRYIEGAKYEDSLLLRTWISELSPAKAVLSYEVVREKDLKVLAKGSTLHAFVDSISFKVINLKKKNNKIWESLSKLAQ